MFVGEAYDLCVVINLNGGAIICVRCRTFAFGINLKIWLNQNEESDKMERKGWDIFRMRDENHAIVESINRIDCHYIIN